MIVIAPGWRRALPGQWTPGLARGNGRVGKPHAVGGFVRMPKRACGLTVGGMIGKGSPDDAPHVLVVGGGIAGIEVSLALRDLAGERLAITLCDPRREFVFRPFAVGEPYGMSRAFRYDLPRLAERAGAEFRGDGIVAIEPERGTAVTRDGMRLPYDYLVLAGGVRMLWAVSGAVTFWGVATEGQVGEVVAQLRAGALKHLVFTMPGGRSWGTPLYELALLSATQLEALALGRTALTVVTPEEAPLEHFGHRVADRMAELLAARGIEVVTGRRPVRFDSGRLRVAPGEEIEADAVVSLPRLEGRRIGGVPHDADGFIGVDEHGRVLGLERVFAAGDVTSFPVKQGGIATQQADAVAGAIAAEAGAPVEPRRFDPVLRGMGDVGKIAGRYISPFVDTMVEEAELEPSKGARRHLSLTRSA